MLTRIEKIAEYCETCDRAIQDTEYADPARLNHLADAIATGNNMEALHILRELAGYDVPLPQHVINRCKTRGWNTISPDERVR